MFLSKPANDTARIALRLCEPAPPLQETDLRVALASCPEAPRAARESIRCLRGEIGDDLLADLELLVSEVVTNSVRHAGVPAGTVIEMRVRVSPERVRVDVGDRGRRFGPRTGPSADRPGGWGLQIVDRIADRVGIESGGRTSVWFEIDR